MDLIKAVINRIKSELKKIMGKDIAIKSTKVSKEKRVAIPKPKTIEIITNTVIVMVIFFFIYFSYIILIQ